MENEKYARLWLVIGSIFGLLSVSLGAFGAHGLQNVLDEYGHTIYDKAVRYQMFHTGAIMLVGVLQFLFPKQKFTLAGWAFTAGILIFSGSLYILSVTGIKWLGAITPIGGTAFLVGWGYLALKCRTLSR